MQVSVEDVRQQKAMALLQYEEAREECERLRREAKSLHSLLKGAADLCGDLASEVPLDSRTANQQGSRNDFFSRPDDYRRAMNYDELVKVNDQIVAAQNSLRDALKVKQTLGLK
jgi:hypothetical protein